MQFSLPFWMRSQPLIPLSILFAAGIVASRCLMPGPIALLAILALGLGVLMRFRIMGIGIVALGLGAILYWARYEPFSDNDLRVLLTDESAIVRLRGALAETPQIRDFDEIDVSTARLHVSEVRIGDSWQTACGEVMTRTRGKLDGDVFYQGQVVEVNGVIQRPRPRKAPGLFDQRDYLRNQRIFFQLVTETPDNWTVLENRPMPILERLRRWAKIQISRGLPEDEPTRMLWAMTLGWKTALNGEMTAPFMRTGTMHIVAVSGLHVACIGLVLIWAMRLLGFSRPHYVWIVPAVLWAYTAATSWQSSGIRSAIMATAALAGWAALRPTELLNSLAAAALFVLAFQPEQLFQIGFQLSFAIVGAIGCLTPFLETKLPMEWRDDPLLPRLLWPKWKTRFNRFTMYFLPNLRITIASFVGALLLTAYYFNLVTPVSLMANLIVVPLSSLALTFSMLSIAMPFFSTYWNYLAWATMWETIEATRWFDQLGWYFYVPMPEPGTFLSFILFVVLVVAGRSWPKRAQAIGWAVVVAISLASFLTFRFRPKLHVLPADGSPVFADLPGWKNDVLIDCSNKFDFTHVVKPFLRSQGVNRLANVVLTHGDVHHVGSFSEAAKEFRPGSTVIGPHASRSPADKSARALLSANPENWRTGARGERVGEWEVLHPAAERKFSRADDNAIVLKTVIQGWRILCLSDLGRDGMRFLAESGQSLKSDILIVGAPTRDPGLTADLLHRVAPRLIVFDPGRDGAATVPIQVDLPILTPQESGAISFEFSPRKCSIRCANGREVRILN